jgi:uncharacterized protein
LSSTKPRYSPSELHGELCGALCGDSALDRSAWIAEWTDAHLGDGDHRELHALIESLFVDTQRALADSEFDFTLKLPDDDAPLIDRAQALAQWTAGFLSGLGDRMRGDPALADDVREVLTDFERIARTRFSDDEDGEEAEADWVELSEYVRVGALLLFEHRRGPRPHESIN